MTSEDIFLKILLHSRGVTALLLVMFVGVAPDTLERDKSSGTLSTTDNGLL